MLLLVGLLQSSGGSLHSPVPDGEDEEGGRGLLSLLLLLFTLFRTRYGSLSHIFSQSRGRAHEWGDLE